MPPASQTIKRSIMKLSMSKSVLLLYSVTSMALPRAALDISKHPVVLVVCFDGLPANKLGIVNTPTLEVLKSHGVTVPYMEPVFPTKTYTNLHTIATGLYAESHGAVDSEYLDLAQNRRFSGFKETPGYWNSYNSEIMPIWILNELAGDGRVSGSFLWPGSSEPFGKNKLPAYNEPVTNVSSEIPWETRVHTVISWITNDTKPANLVFLYHHQPDVIGHTFGPNSPEFEKELQNVDLRTSYLVKKLIEADIFSKINLLILSDHGLDAVNFERIINLTSLVDQTLVQAQFGTDPVKNIMPVEGNKEKLFWQLKNQSVANHFSVWRKEDVSGFPFYYSSSNRIFDIVVLADPGYALDDFAESALSRNKKYNLTASPTREYGNHGYSPLVPSMRATFIAHGPAFVKGTSLPSIVSVDVFLIISRILGIPEAPNNGSLKRVAGMLQPEYLSSGNNFQYTSIILVMSYLSVQLTVPLLIFLK